MALADRVRERRIELGMTQSQLAEIVGATQQSIVSVESGITKRPRYLLDLAKALSCDPTWLQDGGAFKKVTEINTRKIPLISYVQAGALAHSLPIDSYDGDFEYVLTDMDWSENTFALRIEGDSMEPEFKSGDVIVVDPEIPPAPGEFVVAMNGGEAATFKKYRPIGYDHHRNEIYELVPLNSDYPVLKSTDRTLRILGTMVEHRIYRRKR
ncbi:TPA: helix-turn-helix domain-containing protein [Yersinia enterocolitica]|nr:helix-turn-helix domain-containing protein [Yersinia enterocolitica]